jgi:predicted nucleic acid-binding protein
MNVLLDLNVLLDVIQRREPHFGASAAVCAMAVRKEIHAFIPAHALTTISYIVRKYAGPKKETETLDWLLTHFTVATLDHSNMIRARSMRLSDFEDAVVAATAESSLCTTIVSRNLADFKGSPVPALAPEEFLADFDTQRSPLC